MYRELAEKKGEKILNSIPIFESSFMISVGKDNEPKPSIRMFILTFLDAAILSASIIFLPVES